MMGCASIRGAIPRERLPLRRQTGPVLFGLEGSHVNGEAVLHIGLEQSLLGFVALLDSDDFDIGGDVVFGARVEHLRGCGSKPN
jgi:hypothetical protein